MTLLNPFFSRTSVITLPSATVTSEVDDAPFQIVRSPQIIAIAIFQPATATGKLKAVITPIKPSGFHYSIMKWPGLSEGRTFPSIALDSPAARSHISMNSYTSPSPSMAILPISSDTNLAKADFFSLTAFPIYLTISPLRGAGVVIHLAFSAIIAVMQSS